MMKGHSKEVVQKNIKEMISAGHDPKQAVAASLASARKYKKMADGGMYAEGGMVDIDDDEGAMTNNSEEAQRSIGEISDQGMFREEAIANPEQEEYSSHLAKALYDAAQKKEMMNFAMGGLVQDGASEDEPVGNKPEEDMMDSTEEPTGSEPSKPSSVEHGLTAGLSEMAKMALDQRKRKRRFA